jgi:TRAP-type C4-dicarboxylate transport system substrate-binding protein
VLDNITEVNMSYFETFLAINLNTWNKLPPDLQEVIQKAADERSQEQLKMLEAYMVDAKGIYEENGVTYHIASPTELGEFQQAVAPVYDWWRGQVSDGDKYIDFAKKNQ